MTFHAQHLAADALVRAKRIDAERAEVPKKALQFLVPEIETFHQFGLWSLVFGLWSLVLDESGGKFASPKPLGRWANTPSQAYS